MSGLVYVAEDGQLVYCGPTGEDWRRLTHPLDGADGARWQLHHRSGGWGWPCPSPDGKTIAAFHYPSSSVEPTQLRLVDIDGVAERQLLTLEGTLPVYCQWSADSQMVAALVQDGESLQLRGCSTKVLGEALEIESGAPLFFQWITGEGRVLVHVGDHTGEARVLVRCMGAGEDQVLGQSRGIIAAPQLRDGQVWLSLPGGTTSPKAASTSLICLEGATGEPIARRKLEGWVQLLPSPKGPWMAILGLDRASKAKGLGLLHWEDGTLRQLTIGPTHCLHWLPDGRHLVAATESRTGSSLSWVLVDTETEEQTPLTEFWPTPDESMRLRFFSQFTRSHPRLSPDGKALVYAGFGDPGAKGNEPGVAFVHRLDLSSPGAVPEILDRGSLAVYLPRVQGKGEGSHASG